MTPSRMEQVRKLIIRLQQKLAESDDHHFYLFKVLIYIQYYNKLYIFVQSNIVHKMSQSCTYWLNG